MSFDLSTAHARSLIDEAASRRIVLWTQGHQLGFCAPPGTLTGPLRKGLQEHKAAVLDLLKGPSFDSRGPRPEVPFLAFYGGLWDKIRSGRLDTSFTNMQWAIDFAGIPLDAATVRRSVRSLLARYPILCARVSQTTGEPIFRLGGPVAAELVDLSDLQADTIEIRAQEILDEILWRPFRPEIDPLFRPFSIRLGPERHYSGFVLNHLIGDLVSMTTLVVDLLKQWTSPSAEPPAPMDPPPVSYSDYILGMNEWLAGPALTARMVYWKTHLDGATHCRIPPDRAMDPGVMTPVKDFDFSFGIERTRRVYAIANKLAATPYLVLLGAHARALSACAEQRDLILLSMHHGRDQTRLWTAIGSFQNQIPLRVRLEEGEPFERLISRCKETHLDALTHLVPYHYVRGILPLLSIHECFPEFNCFVFGSPAPNRSADAQAPQAVKPTVPSVQPKHARPRLPLRRVDDFQDHKLTLRMHGDAIAGRVTYLPAEHDESSIARFVAHFHEAIDTAPC